MLQVLPRKNRERFECPEKMIAHYRVTLELDGIFRLELVPYNKPLVVFHTISMVSFHFWACSEVVFEFE
jgi:hypothetical protein